MGTNFGTLTWKNENEKEVLWYRMKARMAWFDDLDQRDKDNATELLSQGIQHYNGLHQALLIDMETKFGIIPAQTQQLYEFLYSTKNDIFAKEEKKIHNFIST